jgi:hypothetical protein
MQSEGALAATFLVTNCIPYLAAITIRPIALDPDTPRWMPALGNSLIYLGVALRRGGGPIASAYAGPHCSAEQ